MLRLQKHRKGCEYEGSHLVQADICALPFKNLTFDHLLCTRVLSHLDCLDHGLKELARTGKKGSGCLITDVHPDHPYTHVSIKNETDRIFIKTYKHSVTDLMNAISSNGFQLLRFEEYFLRDLLWKPPKERFGKIYDAPERPIFYICSLRR